MVDVLIYGDTVRVPELRHEVPVSIPDPILYGEHGNDRFVVVGSFEVPRVQGLGLDVKAPEDFGQDELIAQGLSREEIWLEVALRACRAWGIADAAVPRFFPLELADHLRANGIDLHVDRDLFVQRRRSKNAAELEGIRRAQRATEAGMAAAADLIRRAQVQNGSVVVDGESLTSERLKEAIDAAFIANGASADEMIVSHGPQSAIGHESGYGPIAPGEPIVIDLFPKDRESACYADMTRTFVVGEPSDELREYHRLSLEALQRAIDGVRPGADTHGLYAQTCDLFEQHGYKTQRTKQQGEVLLDGFFHGLGHGVGLEVHEKPTLGLIKGDELMPGDVITIEPGLYRSGYGGVRLEDLVLVTDDGAENLTQFPYDLTPRA